MTTERVKEIAPSEVDRKLYYGRPILFDAKEAHRKGLVTYLKDGSMIIQPELIGASEPKLIPPNRQKPTVELVTMNDVFEPLSRVTNPPNLPVGSSLRNQFEASISNLRTQLGSSAQEIPSSQKPTLLHLFSEEYQLYQALRLRDYQEGKFESNYGNYLYDAQTEFIFKIAPEHIHRLALVTSNSHLLNNPEISMSWLEIRQVFDEATIAVAGMSVGSNVMEGILRDIRPKRIKLIDFDHIAITNLQRLPRSSIFDLTGTRLQRENPEDILNPFDFKRPNKAASLARYWHLVDPYLEIDVFDEAIDDTNRDEFLEGVDIVFEELDKMEEKVKLRKAARDKKIVLAMMSDFGLMPAAEIADFSKYSERTLALEIPDEDLIEAVEKVSGGGREAFWHFVEKLTGPSFRKGVCGEIVVKEKGEQTTGGLAQLGGTAMASGRLAALVVAWKLLGHTLPARIEDNIEEFTYRVVFDQT